LEFRVNKLPASPFFGTAHFTYWLVLGVLQNFTGAEGFATGLRREKLYPFYFEFLTRAA
jgi:hypothetical protein